MSVLVWVLVLSAGCALAAALIASGFLVLPQPVRNRALPLLVAFAVGALLGAAFLELLPHALEGLGAERMEALGLVMFATVLVVFLLDKYLRRREARALSGGDSAGPLILVSDSVHKLTDGVVIAAATLTDVSLGVVTVLAVAAHEIPHELSKIAVLLHSGYRRLTAFLLNLAVGLFMPLGALVGGIWLQGMEELRPYVLGVAAALFTYVALAGLLPELQSRVRARETLLQLGCILIGGGILFATHHFFH